MKIQQLAIDAALRSLRSGADGLTRAEAAQRLQEYGANRVEEVAREHLAFRFLKEFTHLFAIILWVAAALAFAAAANNLGTGMTTLGFAIIGVIVVNGVFSFWQEYRAERAISALRNLLPAQVMVRRQGENLQLSAEQLVPGDILYLKQGDRVPADCRLIEATGVRVNNATVTGESLPQARSAEPSAEEDVLHGRNLVLAGTVLISGEARAVVFATGMHTEFGKIAHLTQAAGEVVSPLQREIARVSRLVAGLAALLGVVFFAIGRFIGLPFWENFVFAIGIIVANVPEGLLPTVTLSLAMATQRMAKKNVLIRHLPAVEALGSTTVICTDKTGTLTQNRMSVKAVFFGDAPLPAHEISAERVQSHREFFDVAATCHSLKEIETPSGKEWIGDPMEVALVEMAKKIMPQLPAYPRAGEIPFDADRRRMSVLHQTSQGLMLHTKGALEALLPLCAYWQTGNERQPLTDALRARLLGTQEAMADQGLRVRACAYRPMQEADALVERDMILCGLLGLEDPPRPEVPEAVRRCREAGIRVIMITGDHPRTAKAIAREIGLTQSEAPSLITGEQLRRLSSAELQLALDTPEIIFARVGADQKMTIVRALKRKRQIVAVTGDGVNDAPALKQAHIGIAMGVTGTDVSREAADMILLDDNFASIVNAIEEGRAVFDNIRKFLTYILTSNIPELVPYLAFVLFRIPLPLTVIQILAVDLGTDMLPALGLGAEKPGANVMQRPPRGRGERLLSWGLVMRAYLFLGLIESAAAMAAFFFVLRAGGWEYGELLAGSNPLYLQATTATLSAIIMTQVVNVFLCRSPEQSVFVTGLLGNKLLLWGVAVEIVLILLIDYSQWGNEIFGTAAIGREVWVYLIPFALGMVLLEEARKRLVKKAGRS